MKLRDYQEDIVLAVLKHLQTSKRGCVSLATGGGKTFTFVELAQRLTGNTLILVNRVELVDQTMESFVDVGITPTEITAKKKVIQYGKYSVGMTQTIQSRYKRGKFDYNKYDNIIIDECHRLDYATCLSVYDKNIIGFTATPLINNVETYINPHGKKIAKKIPLAKYYKHLIEGVDIAYLIKNGFLVQESVFVSTKYKGDNLNIDTKTGEYSTASVNGVYDKPEAFEELSLLFETHAKGKKTIIFNGTTKVNDRVYKGLREAGYPVRMYDSVNNDAKERKEIVQWFRDTEGATLCNVNVFTTGFDVKEVECIILNRKTASLSLYLQMVGRGARITDKIFKPHFTFIDLGGNVNEFGYWSDVRPWRQLFSDDTEREIKESEPTPKECQACGCFIEQKATLCEFCGAEQKKKPKPKAGELKSEEIQQIKKPKPNIKSLISYCENYGMDLNKCRNMYYNSIADMFEHTSKETFLLQRGTIESRIPPAFRDDYFLIQRSNLTGNRNRTITSFYKSIFKTISKRYGL